MYIQLSIFGCIFTHVYFDFAFCTVVTRIYVYGKRCTIPAHLWIWVLGQDVEESWNGFHEVFHVGFFAQGAFVDFVRLGAHV